MEQPIISQHLLMQKYPGKGGWTYVVVDIPKGEKKNPFGWVKVKGTIDEYELSNYKLMPMGNGQLFLPIKSQIRKIIKKEAGESVMVTLYYDETVYLIPYEIIECFKHEDPSVYQIFLKFTESEQKAYIEWIYEAKKDETKALRIAQMMERVARKETLYNIIKHNI